MITKRDRLAKVLSVVSTLGLASASALAADTVVYDNTVDSENLFYAPGNNIQFGDQITLDPSTTARTITKFQFEYFATENLNLNEEANLFIYANDGIGIDLDGDGIFNAFEPGTLLFSSGTFPVFGGFQTVTAEPLLVDVPDTFTWAVVFTGVEGSEEIGLSVFDPPAIGSSFNDFWQLDSQGSWSLNTIANVNANFAAKVTAVPEPATIAYAVFGGLGLAGLLYRRRKS